MFFRDQKSKDDVSGEGVLEVPAKAMYFNFLSNRFLEIYPKPTLEDLVFFSRQMHSMLKANVPLPQTLNVIADSERNMILKRAIHGIMGDLEKGMCLSLCFERQKDVFPPLMTSMMILGENTGQLETTFYQIHRYLEMDLDLTKRVKAALRYPLMVLLTMLFAIGVIYLFVVPSFKQLFDSFNAPLPFATQALIFLSDMSIRYWPLGLLCLFLAGVWYRYALSQPLSRLKIDRFKLQIPVIGPLLKKSLIAKAARALHLGLEQGLPLLRALEVIGKSTNNAYLESEILKMQPALEKGQSFGAVIKDSSLFSPMAVQILMVTDETGQVSQALLDIADFYESDVDYEIKRMNALLEPLLVIFLALMVLMLALGVFLPLWDLSSVAMQDIHGG